MQWAVLIAAFLASAVEFVEAFTIVLVVGITINWRSSLAGAFAAAATLAAIVATLGVALVQFVPIDYLRLVVGIILILFGLKWLKKAILRYSGLKALHDEEAIFEETRAELRARGEAIAPRFEPFGVALSYKAVLLEGLEVAFIVITFGSSSATNVCNNTCGITSAAIGATIAGMLVILAGIIIRAPLTRVPENTLKFIVGIMLTTFGTFWAGEGFGVVWPYTDAFILVLAVLYLLASFILVMILRQSKQPCAVMANDPKDATEVPEQEVRMRFIFLQESKTHGRGGIDDASRSLLSWSVRLLTGVINAAPTVFPDSSVQKNETHPGGATLKAIKAVYNFIVGDMLILVGVVVTLLILALINNVSVLAPLRAIEGVLLVVAVLGVLTATLLREALGKR